MGHLPQHFFLDAIGLATQLEMRCPTYIQVKLTLDQDQPELVLPCQCLENYPDWCSIYRYFTTVRFECFHKGNDVMGAPSLIVIVYF